MQPLPGRAQRFTLDGTPALERQLAGICAEVRDGVTAVVPAGRLDGLLLAGGYGRGEGGVCRTAAGEIPYNDLEFYVFVNGPLWWSRRQFGPALRDLGHRLGEAAGVEVEFHVLSLARLRRSPVSMFSYDLLAGHRWLVGSDRLLAGCGQHRRAEDIPLAEATRLVFNRCSGLLFCAERLARPQFGWADADFVARNLAKLQLALGDAWLAANGMYHWSCRERHHRLCQATYGGSGLWGEWPAALVAHHGVGLQFKLRPVRSRAGRAELQRQHAELTALAARFWLWLEQRRLSVTFANPSAYAASRVDKCPETRPARNCLINLAEFGLPRGLPGGTRHPRGRLYHALALLLFTDPAGPGPEPRRLAARELKTRATSFPGLVQAYATLWHRFN